MHRLPCLAESGIHTIVNGPITYTPDGLPLVGRVPGRRNAWCITGLRAGLGEGGGHGWLLAQQMVHGEAEYDTWCLDPRRFGPHATVEFTALKAIEDYQNEFRFHLPHEHRPAGRPARTTPLTPVLEAEDAVFAVVNGWERAAFWKPAADFAEVHSFRFNNTVDVGAAEVDAVRTGVAITEVNGFNRIEIAGPGALDWLDGLICGRVPRRAGKVGLGYTLTTQGHLLSEATLAVLPSHDDADRVWWGSAAAAEFHDMDWLRAMAPPPGVTLTSLTNDHTILVVAGPQSRDLLAEACPRTDWSAAAFPWLSAREIHIGAIPAVAMSVSFSGELAWELHIPNWGLLSAWRQLVAARGGSAQRFGLYAVESMRLEKGYGHWKADFIDEVTPYEAGLDRFVKMDKDFHGKAGLIARETEGRKVQSVTLTLDRTDAPAHPGDAVLSAGRVVGSVTSAGWGHRTGLNIAFAFIEAGLVPDAPLSVLVLGEESSAHRAERCLYDPENARVRAS